jgi:AcrR family transcriptional regulator
MVKQDGRTTRHAHRRPELVEQAAAWLVANGAGDASIRAIADGLGVTHGTLIHHFGSREGLLEAVLEHFRNRQRLALADAAVARLDAPVEDLVLVMWQRMTDEESMPFLLALFEALGPRLRGADPFPEQLVEDWTASIAAVLRQRGVPPGRATVVADVTYDGVRGLMLHLCSVEDRRRVDAAAELFAQLIGDLVAREVER